MEPIKINTEYYGQVEVRMSFDDVRIAQDEDSPVICSPSEALQLAAALYAQFAEWKDVSIAPKQAGYYWGKMPDMQVYRLWYNPSINRWIKDGNDLPQSPTHYTEILTPKP